MKNCPPSMFFEKPALEKSLVNFFVQEVLRILLVFTQHGSLYFGGVLCKTAATDLNMHVRGVCLLRAV